MTFILPNLKNAKIKISTSVLAGVVLISVATKITFAQASPAPKASPSTTAVKLPVSDAASVAVSNPNTISFITSPPQIELSGKPGDTLQTQVKLKNVTEAEQTYSTQAIDFIIAEDGFTPIPVTEKVSGRWSAASWMTMSPTESRLAKNAEKLIDVVIQIPQNALPGGHYAMITESLKQPSEQTQINQTLNETEAVVTPRVGTLVYITVQGNIHEEAFVRDFRAPRWLEFGPVNFGYTIENQSDIHIAPKATITVKNIFGITKEVIEVPTKNIFPLSNRQFEAVWNTFWGFGPYTASLDVAYGTQGRTFHTALIVWIIPYRILLAIAVVVFSLLAIWISIRRHIMHRNDIKTKQIEVLEEKVRSLEDEIKHQQ
ncbi:MAG TPA: hypothetical protein VFG51_02165 [Candidatus Saccharimonadia bacterium]|nr:hypothetical protein [Candidatus Saccharimonadia bacterium]